MKTIDPLSVSSVYGPVLSWRVGWSLGVDLICETSFCSFNCIYCQLGNIQEHVYERKLFVPTEKVMADLRESDWKKSDIITFSGSGEPTLALNIGEAIVQMKDFTGKPTLILTNGTTLGDPQVREEILPCDKVFVKIDAATEKTFQRVNRPVESFSLQNIIEWTLQFKEEYHGYLGVQCMFMPVNLKEAEALADILIRIGPDEVQLNTPKRPYPDDWYLPSRGSHDGVPYPAKPLKVITQGEADGVEELLREKTGLNIVSVYQ
ncbi:MAG: radical SAM protein [Planctomycetota bacterium]|nr:radical SAM protein [Planctomycetota bacterium]MDA1139359.1 radical SAM protein [Planctomycetota bacterium]